MPTLEELRTRVSDNLQDSDRISDDRIDQVLNEGLKFCAREIRLPALESEGTVTTLAGLNKVAIPASWSYQRGLYAAEVIDQGFIEVASSLVILRMNYPEFGTTDQTGDIRVVAVSAGSLVYHPVPDLPVEVTCRFYRVPETMTRDSDAPEGLPEDLAGVLLESYALYRLYPLIENGLEGPQANTLYFKTLFDEYLGNLDSYISEGQSSPEPIRSDLWKL